VSTDPLAGWQPRETDHEIKVPVAPKHAWSLRAISMIAGIIGGLAMLVTFLIAPALSGKIGAWTPSVGDCVTAAYTDEDVKDVRAVDCDDPSAASKVIAVYQARDVNDLGSFQDPCANVPDWDSEIFYGQPHNGFILCLKDTK
jgi:hypothetical protein